VNGIPPAGGTDGRPRALVIRFHSLGDCVLATGVTRAVAETARVTVATEERFRPVFAGLPWIEEVIARESLEIGRPGASAAGGPGTKAEPPSIGRFPRVIDLQGTPGTRRLAYRMGPVTGTIRTRAAARRWLVWWGDRMPRPRIPHAVARYAEAAGLTGGDALTRCLPEVRVTAGEEEAARRLAPEAFTRPAGSAVAIVTGASRRTKEYPAGRFRAVAELAATAGLPLWWIEPPASGRGLEGAALIGTSAAELPRGDLGAAGTATPAGDAMPVFRLPLGALKAVLSRARAVVVSDSGPMHLATALRVPVVAIFGSTVAGFGFSPLGPRVRTLQVEDLPCRPCGVHGRDRCWLGHWRCLRDLAPAQVVAELLTLTGWK
jgi:ADP-heptose:LPS heptosyltransferase